MEINYTDHHGWDCLDSDSNIRFCIEYYHKFPALEKSQLLYDRILKDCAGIYQACEKKMHSRSLTKANAKQLTIFMIFFFNEFEEILSRSFNRPLQDFNDGINYNAPEYCGLYFLGETHFNPITREEFYWVKIGKATNIKKRLSDYNTHCPMLYRIDFKKCFSDRVAYQEEAYYQDKIKAVAIATNNHNKEWFLVDRNTYLEMCAKGFSYFN